MYFSPVFLTILHIIYIHGYLVLASNYKSLQFCFSCTCKDRKPFSNPSGHKAMTLVHWHCVHGEFSSFNYVFICITWKGPEVTGPSWAVKYQVNLNEKETACSSNAASGFSQALFSLFIPFKTIMRNCSYREATR